jgi:hypothetical protein
VESGQALEELLAEVPYRQWVLVPKRLRWFVHRDARLPGEISRLLAAALTDFYRRSAAAPEDAAPAQFHVLQRFGSSVNLHLHDHAVASDGVFRLNNGVLRFKSAPPPFEEVAELVEGLRRRILKRMLRLRVLSAATVGEMLAWRMAASRLTAALISRRKTARAWSACCFTSCARRCRSSN